MRLFNEIRSEWAFDTEMGWPERTKRYNALWLIKTYPRRALERRRVMRSIAKEA